MKSPKSSTYKNSVEMYTIHNINTIVTRQLYIHSSSSNKIVNTEYSKLTHTSIAIRIYMRRNNTFDAVHPYSVILYLDM